jgi:catechol 2,3-dioxygenase-like lactoylglutathione lyase family enzyme
MPDATSLASTVTAMRPMVPAKDLDLSCQFYTALGFQPERLTDNLVEMRLGAYSFILQGYYVGEWADNFVFHLQVSDVRLWWDRIVALDLQSRFGVKATAPKAEEWGLVAGLIDPSGVLWRIAQSSADKVP